MKRELTDEEKEMVEGLYKKMKKIKESTKYWANVLKIVDEKNKGELV